MANALAFEVPGFKPGVLKAAADLSAEQFNAGALNNAGDIALAGAGVRIAGSSTTNPFWVRRWNWRWMVSPKPGLGQPSPTLAPS